MNKITGMHNMGQYGVWLRGSRITVKRNVYSKTWEKENITKYFVIWGGQTIEVERGMSGYFHSVLDY